MKIRFWGVRGSIATPGQRTMQYGGNTSCVSVELSDGRVVIFDAGTGIRECGNDLLGRGGSVDVSLFISHTHWDHIQGFPFFVPSYIPGNRIRICGPSSDVEPLGIQGIMEMQTKYEFFPVKIAELGAKLDYIETREGPLTVDGFTVEACRLNHPVPCFAYRLRDGERSYVYGGDHEPFRNLYRDDAAVDEMDEEMLAELDEDATRQNEKIADFLRDADVVSWDSTYTHEEYEAGKHGWGHSWYAINLDLAARAGVKRLICTHHDPQSTDEVLAAREAEWTARAAEQSIELALAREGMEVEV